MKGNTQITSKYCHSCNKQMKFEKNSMIWGCGDLVMVILTFGGWLVIRLIMDFFSNPWRCKECGSKEEK